MNWTLARRAARLEPSIIREILKVTDRPGVISLAGGLPAAEGFPVDAIREACARVLAETGPASSARASLQYAASEGFGPLAEWVAAQLRERGVAADADRVLITTGSQQGLDLVAKVLIDSGSHVAVESPTYLGALQAFAPFEPEFVAVEGDDDGPLPESLERARGSRFFYVLPNFQNPSGRCITAQRRLDLLAAARRAGVPIVEDNPYGELWYDEPPPPPLAAHGGDDVVYLGSFSKVLVPGFRLGYVLAPRALHAKMLQAKQAADLHTPGFNQRVVHEVIRDGFLDRHVPLVRERYRRQRDAMQQALERHMPAGCHWTRPAGGMFFWVELPDDVDTLALLPRAVEAGVAYVPGSAFYCGNGPRNRLRLSFVTVSPDRIDTGIAALAAVIRDHRD